MIKKPNKYADLTIVELFFRLKSGRLRRVSDTLGRSYELSSGLITRALDDADAAVVREHKVVVVTQ